MGQCAVCSLQIWKPSFATVTIRSTNIKSFHAFKESNQVDHEAQENIKDLKDSNVSKSSNKLSLTPANMRSTNVDNFNAFMKSNQGDPESQENIDDRRSSNATDASSNLQWSDGQDKYIRCAKWAAFAVIFLSSLVSPPLMLYSGISHIHCHNFWPAWFFFGVVCWYLEIVFYVTFFKLNYESNKLLCLGIINTPVFFLWWVVGYVEVLWPAHSISRGYSTIKDFKDQMIKDEDCKLHMFYLPLAITSVPPLLLMGWFLYIFVYFGMIFIGAFRG